MGLVKRIVAALSAVSLSFIPIIIGAIVLNGSAYAANPGANIALVNLDKWAEANCSIQGKNLVDSNTPFYLSSTGDKQNPQFRLGSSDTEGNAQASSLADPAGAYHYPDPNSPVGSCIRIKPDNSDSTADENSVIASTEIYFGSFFQSDPQDPQFPDWIKTENLTDNTIIWTVESLVQRPEYDYSSIKLADKKPLTVGSQLAVSQLGWERNSQFTFHQAGFYTLKVKASFTSPDNRTHQAVGIYTFIVGESAKIPGDLATTIPGEMPSTPALTPSQTPSDTPTGTPNTTPTTTATPVTPFTPPEPQNSHPWHYSPQLTAAT